MIYPILILVLALGSALDAKPTERGSHTPQGSPRPENNGFRIGAVNTNEVIDRLTELNGISIRVLEARMRPGKAFQELSEATKRDIGNFEISNEGFLGKDERLIDVLKADNDLVVNQRRLTHQALAAPMIELMRLWRDGQRGEIYQPVIVNYPQGVAGVTPRRYDVHMSCTRGHQPSPFGDERNLRHRDTARAEAYFKGGYQTAGACGLEIRNLTNGKTLQTFDMLPFLIDRYGFYEGRGTSYRLPPEKILEVFDYIRPDR